MRELYELSAGDIKNGNIRFKRIPTLVTPNVVGGTNANEPADQLLSVTFQPGSTSKQWLYGDKWIFANRNPDTLRFFDRIGAQPGMLIVVEKTGPLAIKISKA